MRATGGPLTPILRAGLLSALVAASAPAAAATGFFDDLPRRGYVLEDYSYLATRTGAGVQRDPVAAGRFVRLALDPGTRDRAQDLWSEREMLLVKHESGELVAFERIVRPPQQRTGEPRPLGRVGLEGTAVEVFARDGEPAVRVRACGGSFLILSSGGRELPVAPEDLGAPTVREGIGRFVNASLGERERDVVSRSVQIALRASQTQKLPLGTLDALKSLFPGQRFDPWPEALVLEPSPLPELDPSSGAWRSVTDAPEILQGAPLF